MTTHHNYQSVIFLDCEKKHWEVVVIWVHLVASCQTTSPQKLKNPRTKIQKHGMHYLMDNQKHWTQNTERQHCPIKKSIKKDPVSYKYCICSDKIKVKIDVKNDDCRFISGAFIW